MPRGRPIPELELTIEEQETLQRWARRPKTAQALALRARMVLTCAEGKSNTAVSAALQVCKETVGKWRSRFVAKRLQGLLDEPRPGAPRQIGDEQVERVMTLTLESTPSNATHWSTRLMARRCGMSQSAISRIWRAFALQPHRSETFKLSRDPLFIEKVRDIVGLYLNPPDRALVLCVDEKAQIQALDRTQPFAAPATGADRAPNPRLRTPRHHLAVCRSGDGQRASGGRVSSPTSRGRVPPLSGQRRCRHARGTGRAFDSGQLWHAQDPADSALVGAPSSLPFALYTHRGVLDQLGGALVRHPDGAATASGRPSQHSRTGGHAAALRGNL